MESLRVFPGVYAPREDSFLLEECVERYANGKVLDLGTGTGIQGITAALKGCKVTFVDINPEAIRCARANAAANRISGEFVISDMFENVDGRYDTIIFNPPYVPTDKIEELSTDGGKDGRFLIDRFWNEFKEHLMEHYTVMVLESSLNGYESDVGRLGAEVAAVRDFDFEKIVVLKVSG
jgi:HemK-related putative methylase